jgi:hypothetical protein
MSPEARKHPEAPEASRKPRKPEAPEAEGELDAFVKRVDSVLAAWK